MLILFIVEVGVLLRLELSKT